MSSQAGVARDEALLGSPLLCVVGSGGVGKTTLAASLGTASAAAGTDTLVMTFDPSLRLKDALGVGEDEGRKGEVEVPLSPRADPPGKQSPRGRLYASLLDAQETFDGLIERYAPDEAARRRILENRFYKHLSGTLAGILEYMAVERLFEVHQSRRFGQVILDTPPTRQALDFLEAPERIVGFLDSGALKVALREWFDDRGRLKTFTGLGFLGRRVESYLDKVIGIDLLKEVNEFFRAFAPLFAGFRERAEQVQKLLRSPSTGFLLVAGPGEERIPDALFFARKLQEAGLRLVGVVVNRIHPPFQLTPQTDETPSPRRGGEASEEVDGRRLMAWLGERDSRGLEQLEGLIGHSKPLVSLPLLAREPTDRASLEALGGRLLEGFDASMPQRGKSS